MPFEESNPPEALPAWRRLAALAAQPRQLEGPGRFARLSARLGPLLVDYSKQTTDAEVQAALEELGSQSHLPAAIADLFAGAEVNTTEGRAALHPELRKPLAAAAPAVAASRRRMSAVAEAVRRGVHPGDSSAPIDAVLHVGIGGSHLGPELAVEALAPLPDARRVRFLANIDGAAVGRALDGLRPATTLVVLASKSFRTLETLANAELLKRWMTDALDASAAMRNFIAVTGDAAAARAFGIAERQCFALPETVGGRYSLWSAVGLPVAVAIGPRAFEDMLAGARLVDEHFAATPLGANLPATLALLEVWNGNFLGAGSHAVLPYDHRLRLLPAYLQQLVMESNGKRVRRDGEPAATHTAPLVWGGEETGGQHAFHQWLHQGTRPFSADFIVCARRGDDVAGHQEWLLANCLAQSQALRAGRTSASAHKRAPGGHPSTTIVLDELTPESLGALLALYEHKVFAASAIWQINAFDQWGVEFGKTLANAIHEHLAGGPAQVEDDSTRGLLEEIRRARGR